MELRLCAYCIAVLVVALAVLPVSASAGAGDDVVSDDEKEAAEDSVNREFWVFGLELDLA